MKAETRPLMFIIQKISQRYDPEQDRLAFTVQSPACEVMLIWLTQRLANRFAKTLAEWLDEELKSITAGRSLPGLHLLEQTAAKAQLKQQEAVDPSGLQAEVLLNAIDLARTPDGYLMTLRWVGDGAARLAMNSTELRQLLSILYRMYDAADWPMQVWPNWVAADSCLEQQTPVLLH